MDNKTLIKQRQERALVGVEVRVLQRHDALAPDGEDLVQLGDLQAGAPGRPLGTGLGGRFGHGIDSRMDLCWMESARW